MAPPKPLADLIDPCLGPTLAAQGFAASDVIVAWPEIVGERLAAFTQPLRMEWRRRSGPADPDSRPEPAALLVRVESAFALELQHLAPLVVERINAHYGWRCVGRLVLKQGRVQRPTPRSKAETPLSPEDQARIGAALDGVAEEPLRAALDRLGREVVGDARRARARR